MALSLLLLLISIIWLGTGIYHSGITLYEKDGKSLSADSGDLGDGSGWKDYRLSLHRAESLSVSLNLELARLRQLEEQFHLREESEESDIAREMELLRSQMALLRDSLAEMRVEKGIQGNDEIVADSDVPSRAMGITQNNSPKEVLDEAASNELSIKPIRLRAGYQANGEVKFTRKATETTELLGDLIVTGSKSVEGRSELYLVLIQPDGKVLKSGSASGIFKSGATWLPYTQKIDFNCKPKLSQNLTFSIRSRNFRSGPYILQIYHAGKMAGKLVCILV